MKLGDLAGPREVMISTIDLERYTANTKLRYETLVIGWDRESELRFCWRYETEEQALAAHAKVVEQVRAGTLEEGFDPTA